MKQQYTSVVEHVNPWVGSLALQADRKADMHSHTHKIIWEKIREFMETF